MTLKTPKEESAETSAKAEATATALEEQAKAIRAAARTIARIVAKKNRSDRKDGAAWADAEKVLEAAGVRVPHSGNMSW